MKDTYKTIASKSEGALFKDRNSKFYGYAFPVKNEEAIKIHLAELKKEHHAARHWCYAWQLGTESLRYRVNDDGEPNNSAGMPIYGQIQSFNLTNTLIVVIRYYGGVKLGVGGLINAYRTGAQYAIEAAQIVDKTIDHTYALKFNYNKLNLVMRLIKEHQLTILKQELELSCYLEFAVRKKDSQNIRALFAGIYEVQITSLND